MVIFSVDDTMIAAVINSLPTNFDSHRFIDDLKVMYPSEYATDLAARGKAVDPECSLHGHYAKRLARRTELVKDGRGLSINVRGGMTGNQKWRKVAP